MTNDLTLFVGYGDGRQDFRLPGKNLLAALEPVPVSPGARGAEAVRNALRSPIGAPFLKEIVKPGDKIALITSDITRPFPGHTVLPVILEELLSAGCLPEDISVVFALGSHRPHTEAEKRKLVSDAVYDAFECIDSSDDGFVHMGETKNGTPVDIMRRVAEADVRIGWAKASR